jgi:hypothetical protein
MAAAPVSDQVETTRRNITRTLGGSEANSKGTSSCSDPVSIRVNSRMDQGQVPNDQILGTVTDPAGGAVPEAAVTLNCELTGTAHTQSTTSSGDYISKCK